jgi:hypothetical protein
MTNFLLKEDLSSALYYYLYNSRQSFTFKRHENPSLEFVDAEVVVRKIYQWR